MPNYAEQRVLPYTPQQLFDLVADIDHYHEFLPWCTSSRVIRRMGDTLLAELRIGYKMLQERFVSNVHLDTAQKTIHVSYVSGPLKALRNEWIFRPEGKKKTRVDFSVQFEFSNPFLAAVTNMLFDVIYRRMVSSFEKRAAQIYGVPKAR